MNTVCLLGRLVKDPNTTEYGKGKDTGLCTRITIAVDRNVEEADFIGCVAFGKTAELIDTYFKKGQRIAIEGRIQTGSYTDKDGNKRYTTDVVISRIHFCENKASSAVPEYEDDEDEEIPFNSRKNNKKSRR